MTKHKFPKTIRTTEELMDQMTTPSAEVGKIVESISGEIMILGVGGKMGPTLAEMLVSAGGNVIGVDVFPDEEIKSQLERTGVRTITCDLFDLEQLRQLPDVEHIFLLAGTKFGATGNEPFVWAMNSFLPGKIMERFPKSKTVYLSSGNVYKFVSVKSNGASEKDEVEPIGEYAMSRLGGERILSYESQRNQTPACVVRLFYATECRYGVIHDIAWKIKSGDVIDVSMGHFNQIWQGDACDYLVKCLSLCESPAKTINLTGAEILSVREVASRMGEKMNMTPKLTGTEADTALLGDSSELFRHFGNPEVSPEQIMDWVAEWVMQGGESLGKPTKYEKRNGKF